MSAFTCGTRQWWVRPQRRVGSLLLAMLSLPGTAWPQTLARPGWAGSGMTVERWWPHAVLCEMRPDSLAAEGSAGEGSALHRLASRLDDLQTLGIDGVLLRGLEAGAQALGTSSQTVAPESGAAVPINGRYGTLEEFDGLVSDATRHGVRVLVELRRGAHGSTLASDARFWLNHGVTGLSLDSEDAADLREVRGVLRGYVGERVLIAERSGDAAALDAQMEVPPAAALGRSSVDRRGGMITRLDRPDLVETALPPVSQGAGGMRSAIERARVGAEDRAHVPLFSADGPRSGMTSKVLATALLGSGGAVLLRVDDLDLAHGGGESTPGSVFSWYRQWSGLHRGNATMRSGADTLLNHDAEGALVWVRQARGGGATIVVICNPTDKPVRLSLVDDLQRLKLRGSFLRTVSRSDGGMGAMPLRAVVLPAFGVYAGELSR